MKRFRGRSKIKERFLSCSFGRQNKNGSFFAAVINERRRLFLLSWIPAANDADLPLRFWASSGWMDGCFPSSLSLLCCAPSSTQIVTRTDGLLPTAMGNVNKLFMFMMTAHATSALWSNGRTFYDEKCDLSRSFVRRSACTDTPRDKNPFFRQFIYSLYCFAIQLTRVMGRNGQMASSKERNLIYPGKMEGKIYAQWINDWKILLLSALKSLPFAFGGHSNDELREQIHFTSNLIAISYGVIKSSEETLLERSILRISKAKEEEKRQQW